MRLKMYVVYSESLERSKVRCAIRMRSQRSQREGRGCLFIRSDRLVISNCPDASQSWTRSLIRGPTQPSQGWPLACKLAAAHCPIRDAAGGSCSSAARAGPWHHHWASDRMNPARGCDAIGGGYSLSVLGLLDVWCFFSACGCRHRPGCEQPSCSPFRREFQRYPYRYSVPYRVSNRTRHGLFRGADETTQPADKARELAQSAWKEKTKPDCGIFRAWPALSCLML